LFDRLSSGPPGLINIRPEVREFSALHQAAYHGNEEAVKILVDKFGADLSQLTKFGKSVKAVAKEQAHWKLVEALELRAVAPAGTPPAKKHRTSMGVSAASSAAASAFASATTATSIDGPLPPPALTPEIISEAHAIIDLAKNGKWKDLFDRLSSGPPGLINIRPEVREFSALHQAAYHGNEEAVKILVDKFGADLSQLTKFGKSVKAVAKEQGHWKLVEALELRAGAAACDAHDVLTPEKTQREHPVASTSGGIMATPSLTPAILGAAHGLIDLAKAGRWTEVFAVLDDRKELVNVRPEVREFGVLQQAAFLGDADACAMLLKRYGADPALLSRGGATAAEVAEAEGHREVYKVFGRLGGASPAADACCDAEDDGDVKMVQQSDGSWKIMYVGADDAPNATAGARSSSASTGDACASTTA